jgi:hypothetical protein
VPGLEREQGQGLGRVLAPGLELGLGRVLAPGLELVRVLAPGLVRVPELGLVLALHN